MIKHIKRLLGIGTKTEEAQVPYKVETPVVEAPAEKPAKKATKPAAAKTSKPKAPRKPKAPKA
jgi:hypothetical protein